jgi:putative nucleotidyltransferase with HDIG domain
LEPNVRLQVLMHQIKEMPALPDVALKVARAVDNPKTNVADVARELSMDQGLTVRLLRLANSAFYGATRRVTTISDAIVLLGMRTVRNLAMAVSCQDMLEHELSGYALREGDLWRHSCCCAYAAQALAVRAKYEVVEEAFVGALLHDIGKSLVNLHLREQFDAIIAISNDEGIPFMDAERRVLGFDHAEAGAFILEKWGLPESLVDTVRYHHSPMSQPVFSRLTGLVHVADVVCLMLGVGIGNDGMIYPLETEVLTKLHLSANDVEETINEVCEAAGRADIFS